MVCIDIVTPYLSVHFLEIKRTCLANRTMVFLYFFGIIPFALYNTMESVFASLNNFDVSFRRPFSVGSFTKTASKYQLAIN